MRSKICLWPYRRKLWSALSTFTTCTVPVPLSVTSQPSEKKVLNRMVESNQAMMMWLDEHAPRFRVSSKNIQVLKEPSEFFEKLKDLSRNASRRITLASLYIGTGVLEKELVSCIKQGLHQSNGSLRVQVLIDYTRGSRGTENSRTLLLPLLQDYPLQMQVSLYHTPKLRGFFKWFLPERWNETIGLSHLKVYLFDDTLVLSGANLSDQYFSNRQDRYIVFHDCRELGDYFDNLVSSVCSMSFLLKPDDSVSLHPEWGIHPSRGNFKEFVDKAHKCIKESIDSAKEQTFRNSREDRVNDTFVYPLLQMYTFGIRQDEQVVENFLRSAEAGSCIKLASGYFNLTNHYMDIILKSSEALYSLLVASPKVNGFYGASGVSGAIPSVYTYIAKKFFSKVLNYKQENRIELHEYERAAWTFHVKGLWYYKPNEDLPSVTFIGSPNFGYRSVYKDLEAQVAIITENRELQMQLQNEQQRFYDCTTVIDKKLFERPDRHVPLWVKVVTYFIRDFF